MLQFIIEQVTGMSYPDYIREIILQPLGMEKSGFIKEKFSGEDNISIPYIMLPKDGNPTPTPTFFPFNRFIYGPGGLISSTNEMIKYVEMLMNQGKVGGKQIISEQIVDQMTQMHFKGRIHPTLSSFGESGYGFGLGITKDFFGDDIVLHGGGITGGVSLIGFLKNSKIGFAAIGNADGFPSEEILSLLAIVIGKNPDVDLPFMKRIKFFEKLQGNYSTYAGINKRKIVNKGGVLFLESDVPPSSVPLIPQTDDPEPLDFYIINIFGVKMPVEFRIDQDSIHFTIERNSYHKQS
jgi:CubicO group peptidase (beta-lactamase class C family)